MNFMLKGKISAHLIFLFLCIVIDFANAQIAIQSANFGPKPAFVKKGTIPNVLILNSGNSIKVVDLEFQVMKNEILEDRTFCASVTLNPGVNSINSYVCSDILASSTTFFSPDKYEILIKVSNNLESDLILDQKVFRVEIAMGQIVPMSSIENSKVEDIVQFCYSVPNVQEKVPVKIMLWESNVLNIDHLFEMETPTWFEFETENYCQVYPINAPPFKEDNQYFWQARCYSNGSLIAASPLQSYVYKNNPERKKGDDYRIITTKTNTGKYLYGSYIRFAFNNRYNEKVLQYKLEDVTSGKQLKRLPELQLTTSLNFIDIDLLGVPGMIWGHMYRLSIEDSNKDKYTLQFSFDRLK